ncbi:LmbE family N-acetylglucosaminyl deacetylase [Trueperella bonasi]|uniref:LmbE family N-acetylglucosaminyl deacetylase n=1 Tax=Trueperella bonasi TaxID=312286 RepID=A0ABT9NFZ6_9ACTO|nr:PIG-L deacetylase family protein [Trueperella bonasi]MDP9806302.1 LmbE family N-acetylglucosaminyl deacetylase [Trueperella bonasi]
MNALHALHWIFAAIIAVTAIVSVAGEEQLRRRVVNYRPPQIFAVISAILLVPANVWATIRDVSQLWQAVIIVASLAGILGAFVMYQLHKIHGNKTAKPRRVLAIGAHPDDLELAVGGTLARLADSGHEIHTMIMTAGAVGGDPEIRAQEAINGSKFLGASRCDVYDFTDTKLETDMNGMIAAIEKKINQFNPDIIFTHSANDQHQDHAAVHLATLRAGRRHRAILCFESPSVTTQFTPKVFVDIDDYVGVKSSAVAIHENQAGKPYMTEDRVSGMAHFRGDQAKMSRAEGFEPVRFDALGGALS